MTTDVFTRYAALDPAAEPDALPDWNAVDAVLLATIDGRATAVTAELEHQKTEPTHQRTWRSPWVAAVAFAVVVLAGIAVIIATTNTDGDVVDVPAPPFGTPTEAADAWMHALNDGTAEDIHALTADGYIGFDIIGPTVAETDERIRWDRTVGVSSYLLDACEETAPTSVTCEIAVTLPIAGLLTGVEQRVDLITVRIDADGYISSTSVHEGPDDGNLYDLDADFGAWLDANSDLTPFELNPRVDSTGQLEMSPEDAAETFLSLLEQFVDERTAPSTAQASTTTVAELVVDAESSAFAEGLMADLNAGHVDAALARFPESATFQSTYFTLLQVSKWLEYAVAVETEFELSECTALSSGNTRCEWYGSSPFEPYYPQRSGLVYQFRLEDGVPTFISLERDRSGWWTTEVQFMNWLAENHPAAALQLYVFPDQPTGGQKMDQPLIEAELKKEYVPLWKEATGS